MRRFEQKSTLAIYLAIALAMAAVLVADFYTPRGIAVWVIYILPVGLSLFVWRPIVPPLTAFVATMLIVLTFFTDAPGATNSWTMINRSFGLIAIWALAMVGHGFIQYKLRVRREEWLQTGLTSLNQQIVGEQKLTQLSENILKQLAHYLNAHAGALFVEDAGVYHRTATYAIPAENGLPDRFLAGEGLVGQAAREGRLLKLDRPPDDYFAIGSALGRSRPRHVVICPMQVDGVVNAILELSFFQNFAELDRDLLDRVNEPVAIAVRSSKYRTRLQELLEETQRQTEELQAQGEELRVSNEELAEQSRALKEAATRLELQQAELEQTNSQLEEQTQLLEGQRDELAKSKASLEAQARELEQASRYKSDFLANMSHELRTPLNSSLILAKLLADNREGNLTPEQVKYASTIQAAGNDLLSLITDILDLSKIEAGRMELHLEWFSLGPVVDDVVKTIEPLAAKNGNRIVVDCPPTLGAIHADQTRFRQALLNLASNANKVTGHGAITIAARQQPRDGQDWITIEVRDTGI
ncbi:MAG: sensor histidine kinase, partial [Tepidisphaeraceae bacterium]